MKLTKENYRHWRAQVLHFVSAYNLEEHLTGLIPCPSPFVAEKSSDGLSKVKKINELYFIWKRFGKNLLSWLMTSLLKTIFSHVATIRTTSEAWFTLEHYFVIKSKARIVNLRNNLQRMKNGSLSINEYIQRMKDIFDALISNGQTIIEMR